jgi:hypothetical protein
VVEKQKKALHKTGFLFILAENVERNIVMNVVMEMGPFVWIAVQKNIQITIKFIRKSSTLVLSPGG